MKNLYRFVSALLLLSMALGAAPAVSFASGAGFAVTYDAAEYEPGSLTVEIYDSARRSSPRLYWIDDGETVRPDRASDGLFTSGGEYYAVVQYTKGQSGGGAGTASGLSDAEIDREFDLYYAAAFGKPVPTLPAPPENGSADDLLDWYDVLYADEAFWAWNEDEDEGYFLDKLTREEIVAEAQSWYDPDGEETLDELIVEVLYDYTDAYRGFTYPYSGYDSAAKRSVIESLIANPQYAPAGYTPPSPSGGGETEESGCYSVLHRLTEDEKAAGFHVGGSFFDGCVPLEIALPEIGTTYDYYTYREKPLYPAASAYYSVDGATVPAFIAPAAEDGGDDGEEGGYGDFITGEDASDLTGAVPEGVPLYVSRGDMLVTASADSSMSSTAGDAVDPFIDWETVPVGASGAKADLAKNRRFVTLDAAESGLEPDDGLIDLGIELTGGDLGDARVSAGVAGYTIDMNTYQYSITRNSLRVKPGTYGKIRISAAEGDETEQRVFIWEKEIGAVTKNATVRAPSRDGIGGAVTTLVFSSLATGEPGPFSPGETVVGDVMISLDGFRLFAAVEMDGDNLGFTETTASFRDGGAITAEPSPVTAFEVTAPEATKTVNATVRFDGMTFSASATLEVGAGAIPPTPTGFSAAASDGSVLFTWDALDFDGLTGYVIKLTDSEGGAVTVAEAVGTSAEVAIDRAAWGAGPWYFTLSAVGGSEGAPTALVRVNDPVAPFSGAGSAEPADAVAERNEFRIESGKTGSLALSFTPDPSSRAEPDEVTATLSYKNIAGDDAAASASLPRNAGYSATLAVPADAAILGSVSFSCVIDGDTVALDAVDLGSPTVVSTVSLVLPESYALAASFDRADLLVGNASYAFARSGAVLSGVMPRRYLPRAEVTFRIGDYKLPMTGTFPASAIRDDSVAVADESLPDVLRLRVRAGASSLPVSATGWFVLPDGKTETCDVSAAPADGFTDFFFDRRGKNADVLRAYVTLIDPAYSLTALTDEDILTDGAEFVRGADIAVDCEVAVKGLGEWMYLNVVSDDDGSVPDGDLIIEISDGAGFVETRQWFSLTRQLPTYGLDPAREYSMRVTGGLTAVEGDPVTVTVVTDGSNGDSAPTLGYSLLTEINLSFILRTDQAGVGETTGELSITADCDVFYKNKLTGKWCALPGDWAHVTDSLRSGVSGVAMNFTSRNVPFRFIDTDAGLKLVFGTDGKAVREYQASSGWWISEEGDPIRLVSGQVFYTVPCDENGGIGSFGLGSYLTVRKNRAEWTLSDKEAIGDGVFVPAIIHGVRAAEIPRVDLRISRQFTEDRVTYVLRSRDGGEGYSKSFEVTTRNDGGTLRHALDGLPYGSYDLLMYVGSGAEQEQLERRFASGEAVAVSATVCGSVTENVTFSESGAALALDMPAEPVSLTVPGIQSVTVTPDRETALRGERLTFSVRFACVPGGTEEKRTLALDAFGSAFEIDSVAASVRTASGSVVTAAIRGTESVSVPQSDEVLTGVVLVGGRVSGSTAAWLDAEAGAVNHSKYDYARGVCAVTAFTANVRAKTVLASAPVSGRGAGGSVITVTATSERDPGRTVSQEVTVARSGYWKTLLAYPTDGFSDTFLVEVRDAEGGLLASGKTEYGSAGVLPSRIKIIWYFDDTKNEVVGYPGEDGTFDALNSAVLTFDPAFADKAVQVEIEFDDSDPDRMGFTDARRVFSPVLRVKPEHGKFAYEYDFLPVSTETFALSIPELGIEEDAVPYTARYFTRFPAAVFGNMTVDYETLTPFSIYSPDYSATGFSGGEADAEAFRSFRSALDEPYAHSGTFDCDFAEYTFGGVKMGQIEGADPEDPEEYAVLPYSGEAHFKIEHDVSLAPVDDLADAVGSFGTPDGTPAVYSADGYIRYSDDRTDACVVLNGDGTVDVVVEHTFNFIVDTGKLTTSAPAGLRRAAKAAGDGDGGLFSMSQSTKETIANIATEVGTNLPKTLVENGKLLANNAAAAEFTTGFIDGMSNAVNVAAVGITAGLELKEDSKAESEMEKLVAELKSKLDKSVAYYNSTLTCYKGGAGDVQRQIAAIRKMADFDLGEVLTDSYIGNKALSGYNVAVSATGFIPVPGAGMVINMLNDSNKELARENQKFYDDTAAWQAYYKAETAMRNAYKKYDPSLCEDHDPEFVDLTDWLKERSKNYTLVDGPVKVKPKRIVDPSGTVYEGMLSNPLAGVSVSIEYLDGDVWRLWEEAPEYNDQLPEYVTDASGFYRWDVPDGKWRVRYFKEGYNGGEPVYSEEMDVPPVWLDVNQSMVSTDPFEAEAKAGDGGVTVRFSRPVKAEDIGLISLECDGARMQGVSFAPTAAEDGLTAEVFAPVVLSGESEYSVLFDGVRTYADTATTLRVAVDTAGEELPSACATVVPSFKNGSTVPFDTGVALSCDTEGAEIFYTLDGTCPCVLDNPARTTYTGPIPITGETTVVAYAVKEGLADSKPKAYVFFAGSRFTDVPSDAYFAEPVTWAVEHDITKGVSDTKFGPERSCTRGQMVTFLWRANGQPEPEGSTNPFRDVKESDYFYKAVLWAVENGITKGISETKFGPSDTVTRGQSVTFLWRALGSPRAKNAANPFRDVKESDYFYDAVLWAVERGVTMGTSKTKFSPDDNCVRGQIVTFLYRAMK